jgi:hypothetical protein
LNKFKLKFENFDLFYIPILWLENIFHHQF